MEHSPAEQCTFLLTYDQDKIVETGTTTVLSRLIAVQQEQSPVSRC
ncbi:MAG: hypothetical protein ACLRVU_06440 [Beduini sp.]